MLLVTEMTPAVLERLGIAIPGGIGRPAVLRWIPGKPKWPTPGTISPSDIAVTNIGARAFHGRPESARTFIEVWNDPTLQELEDVALVDAFFDLPTIFVRGDKCDIASYPADPIDLSAKQSDYVFDPATLCADRFFCPMPASIPAPLDLELDVRRYLTSPGLIGGLWGINQDLTWGDIRQTVLNAVVARRALADYPWPLMYTPREEGRRESAALWFRAQLSGCTVCPEGQQTPPDSFRNFIGGGDPVTEDEVRFFVTMSILLNSPKIVEIIQHDFQRDARAEERSLAMLKYSLLAASAVFALAGSLALPAVATALGTDVTLASTAITAIASKDLQETVKSVNEVKAKLASSDPAFAVEVDKAGKILEATLKAVDEAVKTGVTDDGGSLEVKDALSGTSTASKLAGAAALGVGGIVALALAGAFAK